MLLLEYSCQLYLVYQSDNMSGRKSYETSFKLKVITYAEEHGKHAASNYFKIDRKSVRECCNQKEKLNPGCDRSYASY